MPFSLHAQPFHVVVYALLALQGLVFSTALFIFTFRWIADTLEGRKEKTRQTLEPAVLNLMVEPTGSSWQAAEHAAGSDKKLLRDLMLRQAWEVKGIDKVNMTRAFKLAGFVDMEIAALRSLRWGRRVEAAINLGIMGDPEATQTLIRSLRDRSESVRLAALQSLVELCSEEEFSVILNLLDARIEWSDSRILEALIGIAGNPSSRALDCMAVPQSPSVKRVLAQYAGLKRLYEALPFLVDMMNDPDAEVRVSAAEAHGRLGDPGSLEPLIEGLKDEDFRVRVASAQALGETGDDTSAKFLRRCLSDKEADVRRAASHSLVRLGLKGIQILKAASAGVVAERGASSQVLAEMVLGLH